MKEIKPNKSIDSYKDDGYDDDNIPEIDLPKTSQVINKILEDTTQKNLPDKE